MALQFLGVEIDPSSEVIRRGREECRLRQKSFQVLLYLIAQRDRVVTRQELFSHVWNGAAVTDDALVQSIVEIRKALGDDPRAPRFIRTIPKRGYHFVAVEDARASEAPSDRRWPRIAAVAVVLIAAALAAFSFSFHGNPAIPAARASGVHARFGGGLTSDPEAQRLYTLAVDRANSVRPAEAVLLLQRALRIDPEFAMAHARIGYALGVIGPEAEKARPHLARARALTYRLSARDRMLVDAWQAIVENDFPTAIDRLRFIIDRYPTDIESHVRLAYLLSGEERDQEAITILERGKTIDPARAEIYNALGLHSFFGRHAESIAARTRYVELCPEEPNAYDSLGLSYHMAGRYEEALRAYGRALGVRDDFHIARYHRAATLVQLGRFHDASKDVETVLARTKDDFEQARALTTLADISLLKGDRMRAVAFARRVPRGSGFEPVLVDAITGTTPPSPDRLLRLVQKFNGRGSRHLRRGEFHLRGVMALQRGDHDEAVSLFREALHFKPSFWYVDAYLTGLADAYLQLGRADEALDEYDRILERYPNHAPAMYGRARAREMAGHITEARAEYARFLALWKNADRDAYHWIDANERLARLRR